LVDAKKKRKDTSFNNNDLNNNNLEAVNNNNPPIINKSNNGFSAGNSKDIGGCKDNAFKGDIAISGFREDIRQFNAICYEDVRLLVVYNPASRERDVLAMEVTMAHYKGYKRRPKP